MKWFAGWWGIEILAENKKDEILLRELLGRLPKNATLFYEEGSLEIDDRTSIYIDQPRRHEGFVVRFNR